MSDGCWVENGQDCIQYGWNPLSYDIGIADWAAGWTFEPTIDEYVVPEQIYSVYRREVSDTGSSSVSHLNHRDVLLTLFPQF